MSDFDNVKRMCEFQLKCDDCPIKDFVEKNDFNCAATPRSRCSVWFNHWEEIEPLVNKWIEEHPVKTYLMDFKEKFPNDSLCHHSSFYKGYPANDKDALDALCRCNIYGDSEKNVLDLRIAKIAGIWKWRN